MGLLDIATGRPQRMSDFDTDFPIQERCAIKGKPQKVGAPTPSATISETRRALASDIDMNHHVNNAHYIQWASDSVDRNFRQTHRLTGMTVNFLSQAKLGDLYVVKSDTDENGVFRTSIVSADTPVEYCRLQTEWQPVTL